MFGIKTRIKKEAARFLLPQTNARVFPQKGTSWWRIQNRLKQVKRELENRNVGHNLGWLYTLPHPVAVNTYKYFLDQNPNHLGNWTTKEGRPFATQELEREVIWNMVDLYHADKSGIEGYVTSGGTESNIFSAWMGRKHLEQYTDRSTICLLRTSLTHYSIRKSADIVGIPDHLSPLNPQEWNLDQRGLAETVTRLYKEGFRGFLLPLTLGYTQTGTCDSIEETTKTVERLQEERKDVHFFLWIDAALNGLTTPFVDQTFTPFASPLIQTLVVDFHKFGLVPYPAGVVLYRKNLRGLIEQSVDYLPERDSTLLGSRPGAPAASIWAAIQCLGKSYYRRIVEEQIANKEFFMHELQRLLPKTQIFSHPKSITCGVIFRSLPVGRLPNTFDQRYGLWAQPTRLHFANRARTTEHTVYRFFFLPHVRRRVVVNCLDDLATICGLRR